MEKQGHTCAVFRWIDLSSVSFSAIRLSVSAMYVCVCVCVCESGGNVLWGGWCGEPAEVTDQGTAS